MYHVQKAEELSEIDPEMSIFRLITAEEEAASAILLMLKEHGYKGANALNKNNHLHKQCLYPYISATTNFLHSYLKQISMYGPQLKWVEVEGQDAIELGIVFNFNGKDVLGSMIPPLNFKVSSGEELYNFAEELIKFLKDKGFEDVVKHLKESANMRNKLLYSDGKEIPNTLAEKENGKYYRFAKILLQRINVLIAIYFMTAPYKKEGRALFLTQTLDGYLKVIEFVRGKRL